MSEEDVNRVIGEIQYIPVNLPDWTSVSTGSVPRLLRRLNHMFLPVGFDARWTAARVRSLPFFGETILVELTMLAAQPAYNKYALMGPRSHYVVDWTVEPIYKANEDGPLLLTAGNVAAYLQYFSEFVFTADGQRFPIESPDDLPYAPQVTQPQKDEIREKLLEAGFKPPELTGVYEDGSFRVEVFDLSLYGIYRSVVFITPTGNVDWIVTDLVLSDLPVQRRDLLV